MKKFFVFLLFPLFIACQQRDMAAITSTSPTGTITIEVAAHQASLLDPWRATIKASSQGKEYEVFQEVYADELNEKNVSFKWVSNIKCLVQFQQNHL